MYSAEENEKELVWKKDIPVRATASYIFVGPTQDIGKKCFRCFCHSLEDNESYLYGILKNYVEGNRGSALNEFELECMKNLNENLDRTIALISRKDYSVEYLPIHCHPQVACEEQTHSSTKREIEWSYCVDAEKRAKRGTEIFNENNNRRLINFHSGIGKQIVRDADSRIISMYYIKSNVLTSRYYSYGRNMTLQDSEMAAEFEMMERYAAIVPHSKPDLIGSYLQLRKAGKPMVSPECLSLNVIDDTVVRRYGFKPYSDEKIYRWTRTVNLADEQDYYLPEQVMYYNAQLVSGEKRFIYETSNGCAMGGTYEEAIVYGLLEVVERDAFLMHWYNRVAPVQLNVTTIKNSCLVDIIRYMTCIGYDLRVMDITMETGIPAIWVAAIDKNYHGKVKCYNAAGAHMNPEKALEAALVEVVTSIGIYDKMVRKGFLDERLSQLSDNPDAVENMEDHVYFYSMEENFKYIESYYQNEKIVDFVERFSQWYQSDNHTFTLDEVVGRFINYHPDIYVGVLESEANNELGLYCIKTIVPSMLAMTFGVKNQRLNLERIQKGAVIAGIVDREISEIDINVVPHPFP